MTVPHETSSNLYTANGVTTQFPFTFLVYDQAHLRVWTRVGDVETEVSNGNYSVSGIGNGQGGTVEFLEAPAGGTRILIERDVPLVQESEVPNFGGFAQKSLEFTDDRSVMMAQQLEAGLGRALMIRRTDTNGAGSYQANGNRISNVAAALGSNDAVNLGQMMSVISALIIEAGAGLAIPTYTSDAIPNPYLESSAMFIRVKDPDQPEQLRFRLREFDESLSYVTIAVAPYH